MTSLTKRKGSIYKTEPKAGLFIMNCVIPLSQMFGFSTELRGMTQGQGEYAMEYKTHEAVSPDEVAKIIKDIKKRKKSIG
jgi:elongation factor G